MTILPYQIIDEKMIKLFHFQTSMGDDEWVPDPRNPNEPQRYKTRALVAASALQVL